MERLKNVYLVTAKTSEALEKKKYIFSHSPENAAKKMRVYVEKSGQKFIDLLNVQLVIKDVIY